MIIPRPKKRLVFATLILILLSINTFSQTVAAAADSSKTAPHIVADSVSLTRYKITAIKLEGDTTQSGQPQSLKVDFDKRIVIYVSGPTAPFENQDQDAIYINNIKMPYRVNYNCPCLTPGGTSFTLTCNITKSDSTWNKWYAFGGNYLGVKVDIGTRQKQYTCSTENNLWIKMYSRAGLIWAWIFVVLLVISSILLAFVFKTTLIRDKSILVIAKRPFSLSRFQLLWWSVIIISSYVLLFAIRDDFALLSQSTLVLLGISVAGTGFAAVVDYSQYTNNLQPDDQGVNFFVDVLSDDQGISVHRYQNLLFTFIFGIIFFYKVLMTGDMPNFGPLELSLMGLSTAAYVGLKTGENKTPPPAPSVPAPLPTPLPPQPAAMPDSTGSQS